MDPCEIPRCRAGADITYLGHGVCEDHWNELTADDAPPDALRIALGLQAEPVAAMEEAMDGTGKKVKAEAAIDASMKATKTAKAQRKEKTAKPAKADKPKREKVDNPVVFAFRLSEAERSKLHDAAGGGKASQFVLAAALAAADGDVDAFKRVVEARTSK